MENRYQSRGNLKRSLALAGAISLAGIAGGCASHYDEVRPRSERPSYIIKQTPTEIVINYDELERQRKEDLSKLEPTVYEKFSNLVKLGSCLIF